MGMDLLIAVCPLPVYRNGAIAELDEHTREVLKHRVRSMTFAELDDVWDTATGAGISEWDMASTTAAVTARGELYDRITDIVYDPGRRDVITLRLPTSDGVRWHWLSGGLSGGDSPGYGYDAVQLLDASRITYDPIPDRVTVAASEPVDDVFAEDWVCQAVAPEQRSEWMWFRLDNGDLIFGCYPHDEIYFETEQNRTI
jgi:hypothetical protein